jgi:hypothetical protein
VEYNALVEKDILPEEPEMPLKIPTVHLNGTSRKELVKLQLDAITKLCEAIEAMGLAAPHGRDFYPQGPEAMRYAVAEHAQRVARVQAVADELYEIAEAVQQGGAP